MISNNTFFPFRRRSFLIAAVTPVFTTIEVNAKTNAIPIQVWKDPNCGCCKDWIVHLEKVGFVATVKDQGNNAARARLGMPKQFASCHTAVVGGYVIEGHVPAQDIERLLKEKPQALGLAVPKMPIGSPGMEGAAYGGRRDAYQVLLVQRNGTTSVFNTY